MDTSTKITSNSAHLRSDKITLEWAENNRIAVFTLRTLALDALEIWATTMITLMGDAPLDRSFLSVHDVAFAKSAPTPAIRQYAKKFESFRPELVTYSAIILQRSFGGQIAQLAIRAMRNKNRNNELFFDRESAMNWLRTKA